MLFLCLCVAGFLAGNRVGFREGYASGKAKRQSEDPHPKIYEVGDIIRSTSDAAENAAGQLNYSFLMGAIETSVFPDEWEAVGGDCTMCPVPQLETIVVNATSGVHDRLKGFLADLSSVTLAVAASRIEQDERLLRREEWIANMLQPVSEILGTELSLISGELDLIGAWDVQRNSSSGMRSISQYVFIDSDTVRIPAPDDASKSMPVWYFVSPGSVAVSGRPYVAATTKGDALVLIPTNEPLKFMVATRAGGEP